MKDKPSVKGLELELDLFVTFFFLLLLLKETGVYTFKEFMAGHFPLGFPPYLKWALKTNIYPKVKPIPPKKKKKILDQ